MNSVVAGKQCDANRQYCPYDTAANDGSHGQAAHDAGAAPATTSGDAPGHTSHDAAGVTTAMYDTCQ